MIILIIILLNILCSRKRLPRRHAQRFVYIPQAVTRPKKPAQYGPKHAEKSQQTEEDYNNTLQSNAFS